MAEILRAGKLPDEQWFQTTCRHCSTHFKFKRNEARASGDQRDWGYSIACPLCKREVWTNVLNAYRG